MCRRADPWNRRDDPPPGRPNRKGQPEAVKDHPLRAPETQRPPRITLRTGTFRAGETADGCGHIAERVR